MNIGWSEFLGFYTGLNTTRKAYDEKFTQDRGIGEELEDPNLSDDEVLPSNRLTAAYAQLEESRKPLLEEVKTADEEKG